MYNREYTPERISELKENEIFVFGSNQDGPHGGGLQDQNYAIPTMQCGLKTIKHYVDEFIKYAKQHPEFKFFVARMDGEKVGLGVSEMAPLFLKAFQLNNVLLPKEYVMYCSIFDNGCCYNVDIIRNIGILTYGNWWIVDSDFTRVLSSQDYLNSLCIDNTDYPVAIIGNEDSPILQYDDLDRFGYVEEPYCDVVNISNTVKRIACRAFSDITFSIADIKLPDSLIEIGDEAFGDSGNKHLVIPSNVVLVGKNAFPKDMEVQCLSPWLVREDGNVFSHKTFRTKSDDGVLEYRVTNPITKEVSVCGIRQGYAGNLEMPDSININDDEFFVTGIDYNALDNAIAITSCKLPSHLRKIGGEVFYKFPNLHLLLPETVKYIGWNAFNKTIKCDYINEGMDYKDVFAFLGYFNYAYNKDFSCEDSDYIESEKPFLIRSDNWDDRLDSVDKYIHANYYDKNIKGSPVYLDDHYLTIDGVINSRALDSNTF